METENIGEEISGQYSAQDNASAILRYFRRCGWLSEREIGRSGDNIAAVNIYCRQLIGAIEKIFQRDANGAITNRIFSIYEVLRSALEKDSVRAIRPYTNVFEENTLEAVAAILRQHYDLPCADNELPDEILQRFAIYKEQPRLCLKGQIILTIAGKEIDVGLFADGIEFAAEEISRIEKIKLLAEALTTVENKTSYQRLKSTATAYFYLGGFMSRGQRDFLKQIFRDNPDARYYHFGDIDAGGLYIYEHLCAATGIPFAMYKMSAAELADARNQKCLLPLTPRDRQRLAALRDKEKFRVLADYMLEHNVKLEQEIISLGE